MIELNSEEQKKLHGQKFVDLFCGIGGFHIALSSFGADCVFASDTNENARMVYKENFNLMPKGDIKKIKAVEIPNHDILCGGFPCQSFSLSGNQLGLKDEKSGKLFFEIVRIAEHHKPKLIILENVANIEKHDGGKTLRIILKNLKRIGYTPFEKTLCASDSNIPQSRKRLYIVAFRSDLGIKKFSFPIDIPLKRNLKAILENDTELTAKYEIKREFNLRDNLKLIESSSKKPFIRIGEIGKGRQGERIYSINGCSTTLSSSSGGLGGRTGIYLVNGKIRKLTPRECSRLMGFPSTYKISLNDNQAWKQFGNSIVVDVVQRIIKEAIKALEEVRYEL